MAGWRAKVLFEEVDPSLWLGYSFGFCCTLKYSKSVYMTTKIEKGRITLTLSNTCLMHHAIVKSA